MAATTYDEDVIAWAHEQAELIRKKQFDQLDIDHLAEEIEDVGKSEQRGFARRMVILLASLLKWQFQPERCGNSWRTTSRKIKPSPVNLALAVLSAVLIWRVRYTGHLSKMPYRPVSSYRQVAPPRA